MALSHYYPYLFRMTKDSKESIIAKLYFCCRCLLLVLSIFTVLTFFFTSLIRLLFLLFSLRSSPFFYVWCVHLCFCVRQAFSFCFSHPYAICSAVRCVLGYRACGISFILWHIKSFVLLTYLFYRLRNKVKELWHKTKKKRPNTPDEKEKKRKMMP